MKKTISIAFLFWAGILMGQIQLTGVVKDSIGNPLEMANIIALDTVAKRIASYGFSDAQGNFKLDLNPNTTIISKLVMLALKILVSF